MSFMVLVIGIAGMAGAIEQGSSLIVPAVVTLIGMAWTAYDSMRTEDEEETYTFDLSDYRNNEDAGKCLRA